MNIKYIILAFIMFVLSGITVSHTNNVRKSDSNTVVVAAPVHTDVILASILVNDSLKVTTTDSTIIDSYPCGILTDTSSMLDNNSYGTINVKNQTIPYTALTYYESILYFISNRSIIYNTPQFIVERIHLKTIGLDVDVVDQMCFNIYLYQVTNKLGWT